MPSNEPTVTPTRPTPDRAPRPAPRSPGRRPTLSAPVKAGALAVVLGLLTLPLVGPLGALVVVCGVLLGAFAMRLQLPVPDRVLAVAEAPVGETARALAGDVRERLVTGARRARRHLRHHARTLRREVGERGEVLPALVVLVVVSVAVWGLALMLAS